MDWKDEAKKGAVRGGMSAATKAVITLLISGSIFGTGVGIYQATDNDKPDEPETSEDREVDD